MRGGQTGLERELDAAGRRVARWNAGATARLWAAAAIAALTLLGAADLWLRLGRGARVAAWSVGDDPVKLKFPGF